MQPDTCSSTLGFVLVAGMAAGMYALDNGSALNADYQHSFTERDSGGWVSRPGNAWSSMVYAALAIYLWANATSRPLARGTESAVLAWFAYESWSYHATASRWKGCQDLWCVVYLCLSCTTRYLTRDDNVGVALTWCAMGPLLADAALNRPDNGIVVANNEGMISVLVYILLWFSIRKWVQFSAFAIAFTAKVIDMTLAKHGVHAGIVNGTSTFHVLTGLAMYYHYRDHILAEKSSPGGPASWSPLVASTKA